MQNLKKITYSIAYKNNNYFFEFDYYVVENKNEKDYEVGDLAFNLFLDILNNSLVLLYKTITGKNKNINNDKIEDNISEKENNYIEYNNEYFIKINEVEIIKKLKNFKISLFLNFNDEFVVYILPYLIMLLNKFYNKINLFNEDKYIGNYSDGYSFIKKYTKSELLRFIKNTTIFLN